VAAYSASSLVVTGLLAAAAAVPIFSSLTDQPYYVTFVARVLVLGLAALGLNIALGLGGMVSFGHAVYLGIGAYTVGIAARYGVSDGFTQLAITLALCSLAALLIGGISLRTYGIGFIMITLAFGQMLFFLATSLTRFGGDDGLRVVRPSTFAGVLDFGSPLALYYTALVIVAAVLLFTHALARAPFGMVIRGCRVNEQRMKTLGYPTFRYKLAAYLLSALICGIAGLLYANLTNYASPDYVSWQMSGDLIVYVVFGGTASVAGPLIGAAAYLVLEEILRTWTEHWMAVMGPAIVILALAFQGGLLGGLKSTRSAI
jgi:branched-chain amino acid transport system permease protein